MEPIRAARCARVNECVVVIHRFFYGRVFNLFVDSAKNKFIGRAENKNSAGAKSPVAICLNNFRLNAKTSLRRKWVGRVLIIATHVSRKLSDQSLRAW